MGSAATKKPKDAMHHPYSTGSLFAETVFTWIRYTLPAGADTRMAMSGKLLRADGLD